ncbi:HupE/UreJ family protein [Deltaproteobacteria bacterium PRO3]|nr:HupE/UreJ family protein [Deltaproteobacteria bacterium PRO3]
MKQSGAGLLFLILALLAPGLSAHELKLSDSEILLEGTKARWTHKVHLGDFDTKFARADLATLQAYIPQRVSLSAGGEACRFERLDFAKDAAVEAAVLVLSYDCPAPRAPLQVHYDLFYGDLGHRHLMKAKLGDKLFSYTFAPGHSDFSFSEESLGQSILAFLKLGLEHILIGYDHILFVLALIFGARRFKDLLWLITSFTLAHSITLALATLEVITLPPSVVEPIIAASIVFLALLDLFAKGPRTPRAMIVLTFAFGLIHGLGFSYILQEADLRAGNLAVPLIFFNLGVELGQVLIVALVYPLTLGLSRLLKGSYLYLKAVFLALIAAVGLYWMVERIFFG